MHWDEFYDKFYDWAPSTQVKKLSSLESLGSADEVAEIIIEFGFDREDAANRLAQKAIDHNMTFSAESINDLTNCIDPELQKQLALQSANTFSKEDLILMEGFLDDDVIVELYKRKGMPVPDVFTDDEEAYKEPYDEFGAGRQPGGFISRLAMAFAVGEGIHMGIKDATGKNNKNKWNL